MCARVCACKRERERERERETWTATGQSALSCVLDSMGKMRKFTQNRKTTGAGMIKTGSFRPVFGSLPGRLTTDPLGKI